MTFLRPLLALAFLMPLAANAQLTCAEAMAVDLGTHTAPTVTGTAPSLICAGPAAGTSAGLWYSFTPGADMVVTASFYVTGYPYIDTRVHVCSGACGAL